MVVLVYFSFIIFSISGTMLSRSPAPSVTRTSKSRLLTRFSTSALLMMLFSTLGWRVSYVSVDVTRGIGFSRAGYISVSITSSYWLSESAKSF